MVILEYSEILALVNGYECLVVGEGDSRGALGVCPWAQPLTLSCTIFALYILYQWWWWKWCMMVMYTVGCHLATCGTNYSLYNMHSCTGLGLRQWWTDRRGPISCQRTRPVPLRWQVLLQWYHCCRWQWHQWPQDHQQEDKGGNCFTCI